jgi:hypothetical protein
MKININQTDTSFTIAFDYSNLIVGSYIPFIWDLNTNLWNDEGRLWSYDENSNFYVKLVSQYTHQEYIFNGVVNITNDRYTEATFSIENNFIADADDGFYYTYFVTDGPEINDAVVIYETLSYVEIQGKKPTFISNISDNETRQIIYAD